MPEYKQTYSSSFSTFTSNRHAVCRKLLLLDDRLSDQYGFSRICSCVRHTAHLRRMSRPGFGCSAGFQPAPSRRDGDFSPESGYSLTMNHRSIEDGPGAQVGTATSAQAGLARDFLPVTVTMLRVWCLAGACVDAAEPGEDTTPAKEYRGEEGCRASVSESHPRAELGFAARVHGHGDGSKLGLVDEAVGRTVVGVG